MSKRVLVVGFGGWHIAGRGVEIVGNSTALAYVPLVEVGDLWGEIGGAAPLRFCGGRERVTERRRGGVIRGGRAGGRGWRRLAVHLHVFPQ